MKIYSRLLPFPARGWKLQCVFHRIRSPHREESHRLQQGRSQNFGYLWRTQPCRRSQPCHHDVDWQTLHGAARLGVTAGASAPEILVEEVIEACRERFEVTIEEVTVTREDVQFKLPRELADTALPA